MSKVFINAGHGGSDSGATGNGLLEKNVTKKIAKRIVSELKKRYKVNVKFFQQSQKSGGLTKISNASNKYKPDMFVSVHINAGGGTGFESYVYSGLKQGKTTSYQKILHDEIMKINKKHNIADRGKKSANFHVLRETTSPAILTENLFIDTKKDANLLKKTSYINDVAEGHVQGIVKCLGLKAKKKKKGNKFYRVVTGSYRNKENAENKVKELKKKGYDSFIDIYRK